MKNWFILAFGLKGSWTWACKWMELGSTVKPAGVTGSVTYRFDREGQRRVMWAFKRDAIHADYENANMFMADFERTDWEIVSM